MIKGGPSQVEGSKIHKDVPEGTITIPPTHKKPKDVSSKPPLYSIVPSSDDVATAAYLAELSVSTNSLLDNKLRAQDSLGSIMPKCDSRFFHVLDPYRVSYFVLHQEAQSMLAFHHVN